MRKLPVLYLILCWLSLIRPSTAQELSASDRAAALVAMKTGSAQPYVHTCNFFLTACSKAMSPALADMTLELPDTFSRHRFSARVLNVLSALYPEK
jgi:hypothetical protein